MKKTILITLLYLFVSQVANSQPKAQALDGEVLFTEYPKLKGYAPKKRKHPEMFQGNQKQKHYFEGWYFKMVSANGGSIISVIPGISLSAHGKEQHAFIQLIDGTTAETSYYSYPIQEFAFSKNRFAVRIGNSYFSEDSLILNIRNDSTRIEGKVFMTDQMHLTKNNKPLNIMGWYRFAPFMECYHAVVSLNHQLQGQIIKNGQNHIFDNGRGYIEKDWGTSMPSSWIWIQSNHFHSPNSSFMLSVATIPWLGGSFTGFLGFFWHNDILERFGTYSHAKVKQQSTNADTLKLTISDKKYTYYIEAYRNKAGMLKAPSKGSMDRRIAESIDAHLKLKVVNKNGETVFNDSTTITGLETVDVGRLAVPIHRNVEYSISD